MGLIIRNKIKPFDSSMNDIQLDDKIYILIGLGGGNNEIMQEIVNKTLGGVRFTMLAYNSIYKISDEAIKNCDTIIVSDYNKIDDYKKELALRNSKNITIEYFPEIAEKHLKRIPVKLFLAFEDYYNDAFAKSKTSISYRFLDLIIALLLILLTFPFLILSMIYIYIKDGRPFFYRQKRRGLNTNHFTLHKLRSYDDVTNQYGKLETISTGSGHLLRKFRLNELPQLFNVIIGNMSMVGPRPDDENDFQQNIGPISNYIKRYNVLPGITGHAQVYFQYCNTVCDFEQRLEYDLYYLKNQSVKLYLLTLLRTIKTIFLGKGK